MSEFALRGRSTSSRLLIYHLIPHSEPTLNPHPQPSSLGWGYDVTHIFGQKQPVTVPDTKAANTANSPAVPDITWFGTLQSAGGPVLELRALSGFVEDLILRSFELSNTKTKGKAEVVH